MNQRAVNINWPNIPMPSQIMSKEDMLVHHSDSLAATVAK